jgi:hypothetical protein
MKKSVILLLFLFTISPSFAKWDELSNSCQKRVSFFGLLTVWTGSITLGELDDNGVPTGVTKKVSCTPDGNWDWAW